MNTSSLLILGVLVVLCVVVFGSFAGTSVSTANISTMQEQLEAVNIDDGGSWSAWDALGQMFSQVWNGIQVLGSLFGFDSESASLPWVVTLLFLVLGPGALLIYIVQLLRGMS